MTLKSFKCGVSSYIYLNIFTQMFVQPLLCALKSISQAKYKKTFDKASLFTFVTTLSLIRFKFYTRLHHTFCWSPVKYVRDLN